MANDTWTIDVNLKGATGLAKQSTQGGFNLLTGAKTILNQVGSMMSSALKGIGIASGILLIAQIVLSMKQLISMVSKILKLIGILLSPIADVITAFLLPILMIIKPIAMEVKKIMMPFTRLAMEMFKQFAETGEAKYATLGTSALIAGLASVVVVFFKDLIKFTGSLIIAMIGDFIGVFIPPLGNYIKTAGLEAFNKAIDSAALVAVASFAGTVVEIGNALNIDTTSFSLRVVDSMKQVFGSVSDEAFLQVKNTMLLLENDKIGLPSFILGITAIVIDAFDGKMGFAENSVKSIDNAFTSIVNTINERTQEVTKALFTDNTEENKPSILKRLWYPFGAAMDGLKELGRDWGERDRFYNRRFSIGGLFGG